MQRRLRSQATITAVRRRGIATLWLILALPVFLTLFALIVEIGSLWLARVELKNSLDASSLAAVKVWAETSGTYDTLPARRVGVRFAYGNNVGGLPLHIQTNYGPGAPPPPNPNQNLSCDGNLIFGAIDTSNMYNIVFNAGIAPSCNANIVMDVTGSGQLNTGNDQEWGISYQPSGQISGHITRVIYAWPENPVNGVLPRFGLVAPEVSANLTDCAPNNILADTCPGGGPNPGQSAQADVYGIKPSAVRFYYDVNLNDPCQAGNGTQVSVLTPPTTVSRTMAVEFDDSTSDPLSRFDVEDHMRFGAVIRDTISNGQLDADDAGQLGLQVTVCFDNGLVLHGMFVDTTDRKQGPSGCLQCADVASWGSNTPLALLDCNASDQNTAGNHGLIIHPQLIPDVPCPATSNPAGNGQSLVVFGTGTSGINIFGVRAQATVQVQSPLCNLFGFPLGPYPITAKSDAMYRCVDRSPRLVNISTFICPGP